MLVAKVLYRFSTSAKPNEVAIYYTGASLSEHHLVSTTAPLSLYYYYFIFYIVVCRSHVRRQAGSSDAMVSSQEAAPNIL